MTRTHSDPQRSHCTAEDDYNNCAEQLEPGPLTCLTHSQRRRGLVSHTRDEESHSLTQHSCRHAPPRHGYRASASGREAVPAIRRESELERSEAV